MAIEIQKLYNGNVYIDGVSHFGSFEEVTLPQPKAVMQEHKALGMIGKQEFTSGLDKLEMKIKWNGPYDAALLKSHDFYTGRLLMIRGSRETWDAVGGRSAEEPVVAFVTGIFKSAPGIGLKPQTDADLESELAVSTYRLEIGGRPIVNIDLKNQVYEVGGVDLLAKYRANLGI